ncbi:MAG TPA: lysoplasmalogenase family protein [Flavobacterium lutivivi]|nr:lysoplasmalogenase family protein [Flavobacterium lutivivi]
MSATIKSKFYTALYITVSVMEILAEYFQYDLGKIILKPLIPIVIIAIYLNISNKKDCMFIVMMLLSVLTNVLFIPNSPKYLFYGLIVYTFLRFLMVYITFKISKLKDFIPLFIATSPFLIVFFYLFFEGSVIPEDTVPVIIVQNVLISLFAGLSLSSYVMNDNKQNSILLISALLFVMLQLVVFVEKFYLENEYSQILRPMAMTLNAFAFYAFLRFVLEGEKSNNY